MKNLIIISKYAPKRDDLVSAVNRHNIKGEKEIVFCDSPSTYVKSIGVEQSVSDRADWAIWLSGEPTRVQYIRVDENIF